MVKFAYKLIRLPSASLYKFLKIIILRGGTKMNNVQKVNECNQETVNTSNLNEKFEIRISKSQLKEVIENLISSLDIETFAVIVSTFFRLYENKCETITLQKESNIASLKEYICNVAIPIFEDAIINTGETQYIYDFAYIIKGANISKLEDAIINTGDMVSIYNFAKYIKGANISKLEDGIINTGYAMFIYKFASDINGANISKLEDAIINTGDIAYIYNFARDINGANISKLKNYVKDTVLKTMETGSTEDISDLSCCLPHQIADEIKFYDLFN